MSEFTIGELSVFKSHPYIDELINIKITAYSDYTSPILVVKQVKDKSHDKTTGKDIAQELNCCYYSSRDGKFIDRWISSDLVKKISFPIAKHKILFNIDLKGDLENAKKEHTPRNYENLIKKFYINKMVVLKSVDIELEKKKINRTKENGDLAETNHLEFLPPVMTIIGYKYTDEKHKFCEKTGQPLLELKCKWYNSNSKTFSESLFPYDILYSIKNIQDLFNDKDLLSDINDAIETNVCYNLPIKNPFPLEESDNIKISKTIGYPTALLYKHYFYQMNFYDYITQNKSAINLDTDFDNKTTDEIFGEKYPNYSSRYKSKVSNCKFKIDNYYFITYRDSYDNTTKRVVKVKELLLYIRDVKNFKDTYDGLSTWNSDNAIDFVNYSYHDDGRIFIHLDGQSIPDNSLPKSIFDDKNVEIFLRTNCLLRKGKYRNFLLNRVLEVTEIKSGETLFEK